MTLFTFLACIDLVSTIICGLLKYLTRHNGIPHSLASARGTDLTEKEVGQDAVPVELTPHKLETDVVSERWNS
jgi:hypothetical protein